MNAAAAEENAAVAEYVDFYLGDGIARSRRSATCLCPTTAWRPPRTVWEARTTGTNAE